MEPHRDAENWLQRGSPSTALALRPAQVEPEQRPNKNMRLNDLFDVLEEPYWSGYAAFQFTQDQDQFHVIGDAADMTDFTVDDENIPAQPEHLHTSRWGQWGYSTWCSDIDDAITEAVNSKSRGWRRIPGNTQAQTKESWWIVFGLELGVMQIREYLSRFKLTSNVERKGVSAWRIMEDINVREIEINGGKLTKTIVKGRGQHSRAIWSRVPIIPDVMAEQGRCARCDKHNPLYWQVCAECYARPRRAHGRSPMEQVNV